MSDPRHTDRSLSEEAARHRRNLREAQTVIADQNKMLLDVCLRGRMQDPTDFFAWVKRDTVVDKAGRINWQLVMVLADELLEAKPHLAAAPDNPWKSGTRAIEWFLNSTE